MFAQLGTSTTKSAPALYLNKEKVVSVLNLIIQMEDGKVSEYVWDTGCNGCEGTADFTCINNFPMTWTDGDAKNQTASFCGRNYCSETDAGQCDLRIFVTWVGTDSRGKYLESAGYRISNFKRQNVGQIYASMAGVTSAIRPDPATLSPEATTAINSAT